jgi:hypothetical protein
MRLVTRGDLDGLTCAVLLTLNEDYGGEAAMPQFKELVRETDRLANG